MTLDGLLLVDKRPGCTSHDVVQQARRILRLKRIGHCGTLDPDATGLLLLTLGQATRLTRFLIHAPKVYAGTIRFGVATDTFDAAGRVLQERPTAGLTEAAIDRGMERFLGSFQQTLPAFSAHKRGGVKFYEMARRGEEVPVVTKEVTVAEFARSGPLTGDLAPFRLSCSSGTYARSLANELGNAVDTGAHLASLRRLEIGPFHIDQALTLDELAGRLEQEAPLDPAWLALEDVPLPFPGVIVDSTQENRLRSGQTVLIRDLEAATGDWVRVADRRQSLIAIGSVADRLGGGSVIVVQPRIVFAKT